MNPANKITQLAKVEGEGVTVEMVNWRVYRVSRWLRTDGC